jgi:hypothetical protein
MTGYLIKNTPHQTNRFHVYRPGEQAPSFMVPTVVEALDLVALDKAQPVEPVVCHSPLNRCFECQSGDCPCLPL